jgi:cation diffusion facilitator family transporter
MSGGHDDHDHEHQHEDDHTHEHRRGLKGVVLGIFAPHSHDAADSIDTALESSRRGIRAVKISFAALLLTSLLQLGVILVSGSVALLADTIHNFSDALTAIPLFIAFRLARRPPTRRYTYGFGRAEDLAGLFVIATITLSAIIAAVEAIRRLVSPQGIDYLGWVAAAGIVGFLGNELVALYRIREGNAIGSAALVADGYHARTDGFTSLAVVLGAVGVWAGWPAADPIAGLLISIAILAVLRRAALEVLRRLMNGVDPHLVEHLEHEAAQVPGVVAVHEVQVRWEGHRLYADLAIGVSPNLAIADAHAIAHAAEHELLHHIAHLDHVTVHIEPDGPSRPALHADLSHHQ